MPARRRPPGVRLGLDRRSGPVGSAFLVDVTDDILALDCDSADRVEVVQEIATEFQSRRPTAAEMSAWYRRDPRAGVAIVCEAVSGLAVVDFDPRNSDGTARAVPRQEFCCLRQP